MVSLLRSIQRMAPVVFALFLIYFTLRIFFYHFTLVTFPYPVALREGAMMTSTQALVKGLNPYAMSLQPQFMNQYGIIYPLLVFPLAKCFGVSMLIHRMVTAFFILASCFIIYAVLKRMRTPLLLNAWAVVMFYASLTYPGTSTPTVDPGATGTCFFLSTIFIPWFCNYSYKSLVVSILCGLLAFYSKPYFVLGTLIMTSYVFLFVSKKKGLIYSLVLLALSAISVALVNGILPAYFDNCFFTSANMAPAWSNLDRLHEQIRLYTNLHGATIILIGAYLLGYGIKFLKHRAWPGIRLNCPLALYAALCSSLVLYMSLGRHSGALLWYFFQLLSPFFLICAAWLFGRYIYWPMACLPFLVYSLFSMTMPHDYKQFDRHSPNWPEVALVLSQYHYVLNSPIIAPLLIEQNKDIVDDGQAEYFYSGGERKYWMKGLFKEDGRIFVQHMLFFDNIRNMVEQKRYDLIMLQPSLLPLGVDDFIKRYYKLEGEFTLYAPQDRRSYGLTVWKPL